MSLTPKNLTIPVEVWYKNMRIHHNSDEINGRTGKSRQKFISHDIVEPYLNLRTDLEALGITGVMMADIVEVIKNNESIINLLKKQASKKAA